MTDPASPPVPELPEPPPAVRPPCRAPVPPPALGRSIFARVAGDFRPVEGRLTLFAVADHLLKKPGRLACELVEGRAVRTALLLWVLATFCLAGYGVLMGAFSGGHQLWAAPLKVAVGTLLSALICLPSLYILSCLAGGEASFAQTSRLLLQALGLGALLLVGFAPVTWLFSQSTDTVAFMAFLHLLFWLFSTAVGLRLLSATLHRAGGRRLGFLGAWAIVFVAVALQMCTTLRPMVGPFDGFRLSGKKFFVVHWMDTVFRE
jgi:hypothetical protein